MSTELDIDDVATTSAKAAQQLAQLRAQIAAAHAVIARGVEIMTPEQLGQWDGVRAWQEQSADAYAPGAIILRGILNEIGSLASGAGRGIGIETQGETIEVLGMTEDECRTAARWWGEVVTVAIQPINAERNGERSESDCRAKLGDLESKHG